MKCNTIHAISFWYTYLNPNRYLFLLITNVFVIFRQKTYMDKTACAIDPKTKVQHGSRVFGDCDILMEMVMKGSMNPATFPIRVCRQAIKSRFASAMGMACFCSCVGLVKLYRLMFRMSAAGSLAASNDEMVTPGTDSKNYLVKACSLVFSMIYGTS